MADATCAQKHNPLPFNNYIYIYSYELYELCSYIVCPSIDAMYLSVVHIFTGSVPDGKHIVICLQRSLVSVEARSGASPINDGR